MMLAWSIKALLTLGLSEATSIKVAQSKWLRKITMLVICSVLLIIGGWYLTHLGGEWREAEISDAWRQKFAELDQSSMVLQYERELMPAKVAALVQQAKDSAPVVLPALPVEPEPIVLPGCPIAPVRTCAIPAVAAKRYNAIGK